MQTLFNNHKSPISYNGFTLIELLVAMTVIAIVFLVGYANFREFSRRQDLIGITRFIRGEIRYAQQLAASGHKPEDSCTSAMTLEGYNFSIDTTNLTYTIAPVCSQQERAAIKDDIPLPDGIGAITAVPSSITFKVLRLGTDLPNINAVITITQEGTGNTATITVTPGGEIR